MKKETVRAIIIGALILLLITLMYFGRQGRSYQDSQQMQELRNGK